MDERIIKVLLIQSLEACANPLAYSTSLGARALAILQDERAFEVGGAEAAVFSYFGATTFGQSVEAQVVFVEIDLGEQALLERFELHPVDLELENGFLDPLADAFADFGDATQSAAAGAGFCVDVVAGDDQHGLPREIRWVVCGFAAQGAGEQPGLDEGDEAEGDGLGQQGMGDLLLLALLPGDHDGFAGIAF